MVKAARFTTRAGAVLFALPIGAVLLVAGALAVGHHHHDAGTLAHPCAVCTVAHAPALAETTTTVAAAPRVSSDPPSQPESLPPAQPLRSVPLSRAPPLA